MVQIATLYPVSTVCMTAFPLPEHAVDVLAEVALRRAHQLLAAHRLLVRGLVAVDEEVLVRVRHHEAQLSAVHVELRRVNLEWSTVSTILTWWPFRLLLRFG